jgi:hypothetical protein
MLKWLKCRVAWLRYDFDRNYLRMPRDGGKWGLDTTVAIGLAAAAGFLLKYTFA